MKIIAEFDRVRILSKECDFNWAKLSFMPFDQDGDIVVNIEIKVPKTIQDIREIKKYALEHSKGFLSLCGDAHY